MSVCLSVCNFFSYSPFSCPSLPSCLPSTPELILLYDGCNSLYMYTVFVMAKTGKKGKKPKAAHELRDTEFIPWKDVTPQDSIALLSGSSEGGKTKENLYICLYLYLYVFMYVQIFNLIDFRSFTLTMEKQQKHKTKQDSCAWKKLMETSTLTSMEISRKRLQQQQQKRLRRTS